MEPHHPVQADQTKGDLLFQPSSTNPSSLWDVPDPKEGRLLSGTLVMEAMSYTRVVTPAASLQKNPFTLIIPALMFHKIF